MLNVKAYEQLAATDVWKGNQPSKFIGTMLRKVRIGLYDRRQQTMDYLFNNFNSTHAIGHQVWDLKGQRLMREAIVHVTPGLGMAKSSFGIELVAGKDSKVICLDTHMLQLYGLPAQGKLDRKTYTEIEDHWYNECRMASIPPAITRHVYWDSVQGKPNTRYWSYVFEN